MLISRYCVHDYKVNRGLRGASNLKHVRLGIQLVLHYDRLVPGQSVGYAVLLSVQNGLWWCEARGQFNKPFIYKLLL